MRRAGNPETEFVGEVTDRALRELRKALRGAEFRAVRIVAHGREARETLGLELVQGPGPGDVVSRTHGVPVVADRHLARRIQGVRIGYTRREGTGGFTLSASSGCGCGPDCGCSA